MTYQTILFDLDGTLIDPKLGITSAVQYALARFGINEDREALTPFIGPPLHDSFKNYYNFSEKKTLEAIQYFREYYLPKGMYESTVYRGIPELLTKLKKAKKKLYVVTTKPTFIAEKVVQYHNLFEYFDVIIGSQSTQMDADKTTLVAYALKREPTEKKESFVMIGDREHDIIGAQANGVDSIGVTFGYGSHEEIKNAKPAYIVNTIKELDKCLL